MIRTIKENDVFFEDLMKLETTFYWKGHELQLKENHIQVVTLENM
jgi:hypothetical protein